MTGFERYSTDVLIDTRTRLLAGLDKVSKHIAAGTLDHIEPGKHSPPRESGAIAAGLLVGIEAELARREAL